MNSYQKVYAEAKKAYDKAHKAERDYEAQYEDLFEQCCETGSVELENQYNELIAAGPNAIAERQALVKAESELIAWALKTIRNDSRTPSFALKAIDELEPRLKFVMTRQKFIGLTMQLDYRK